MGILDSLKKGFNAEDEEPTVENTLADMVRTSNSPDSGRARVIVVEPMKMEECNALVECIRHGLIIIINTENVEPGLARRIVDFLTGATRAIDGRTLKINAATYIFAPADIDIATRRKKAAPAVEEAPAAPEVKEEAEAPAPEAAEEAPAATPYHGDTIVMDRKDLQ